ncbi:MAG: DUF1893 domain-containing protein [Clostridia bacterium]|nr:DUF1893 domain-containing protein [Clostridia bacterium]
MTDLQTAKKRLAGHSMALCKGESMLYSDRRGIAPMLNFIAEGVDLSGYSVADQVVGKAAAMLFVKCGVKAVYAKTLSRYGKAVLEEHGIFFEYEVLTNAIMNRTGTDICPMEKTVMNTQDAEEAYRLLKQKAESLRAAD